MPSQGILSWLRQTCSHNSDTFFTAARCVRRFLRRISEDVRSSNKKKMMGHTRCTDRRGVLPSRQNQFFIRECVSLCSRGLRGPRHTRRWPLSLLAVGKLKLGPEPLRRSGSRRPASDGKRLGFFFSQMFHGSCLQVPRRRPVILHPRK